MIKLIHIKPRGFCCGVSSSIFIANKISKISKKKIYMLGFIVHNYSIVNEFLKKNIKFIYDKKLSKYDWLKMLVPNDVPLILSAHGTDKKIIKLAKQKNCKIIDTTCVFVNKTHDIIKKKLDEEYDVLFIGKRGHPETDAILAINEKIKLITSCKDIDKCKVSNDKIIITNQTTLSYLGCKVIFKYFKKVYPKGLVYDEICDASKTRQMALIDLKNNKNIGLILIVGSVISNNSKELVKIGKSLKIKTYLVENDKSINESWFKELKKDVVLGAGASTPHYSIESVSRKINQIIKKINNN